jgi:hypothetical protein
LSVCVYVLPQNEKSTDDVFVSNTFSTSGSGSLKGRDPFETVLYFLGDCLSYCTF